MGNILDCCKSFSQSDYSRLPGNPPTAEILSDKHIANGVNKEGNISSSSSNPRRLRSKDEIQSEGIIGQGPHTPLGSSSSKEKLPVEFSKLYELGNQIGIGTTSKVYLIHPKHKAAGIQDVDYACKIIDKRKLTMGMDKSDVESLLQQLRREVYILRGIKHANIVELHDFMESRNHIYIIIEYIQGEELFSVLASHGAMLEEVAKKALYGIFSAISYLHSLGVIHRDIKAENIIVQQNNGIITFKLIDFGFSTMLKHDLTGSFLGTAGYIAPEIRQNKVYSSSVDMWALGVLVYCVLAAQLPFTLSIDMLPTRKKCEEVFQLKFPHKKWHKISDEAKDLIRKLLMVDPFTRLTAKEALNHPWFKGMGGSRPTTPRMTTPRLAPPAILNPMTTSIDTGDSTKSGTTSASASSKAKPVIPKLPLKEMAIEVIGAEADLPPASMRKVGRSHSTTELEKKGWSREPTPRSPRSSSNATPRPTSEKTELTRAKNELENDETNQLNERLTSRTGESNTTEPIQYDSISNSSMDSPRGPHDHSIMSIPDGVKITKIRTPDISIPLNEDELNLIPKDLKSPQRISHSFVFDEAHHVIAGDLFFSTYMPNLLNAPVPMPSTSAT